MLGTLVAGILAFAPVFRDVSFEEAKKDPSKRAAYVEQLTAKLKPQLKGVFYMGDEEQAKAAKVALQAQWKDEGRAFFFEKESKPVLALLENPSLRVLPVYREGAIAGQQMKSGILLVGDIFSLSNEDEVKSCVQDYASVVIDVRENNLKVGELELDANIPALKLVSHRSLIQAWAQANQFEAVLKGKRKVSDAFKGDLAKQYIATHKLFSIAFAKERKVFDDNNENTLQKEIVDFLDGIWKNMHTRIAAGGYEIKLVSKENHEYELVPNK
jgi:hypothetical protein